MEYNAKMLSANSEWSPDPNLFKKIKLLSSIFFII